MSTNESPVREPLNVSDKGEVRTSDIADRVAKIRESESATKSTGEGCNGGWGN